jgi:hypothetical protein
MHISEFEIIAIRPHEQSHSIYGFVLSSCLHNEVYDIQIFVASESGVLTQFNL